MPGVEEQFTMFIQFLLFIISLNAIIVLSIFMGIYNLSRSRKKEARTA